MTITYFQRNRLYPENSSSFPFLSCSLSDWAVLLSGNIQKSGSVSGPNWTRQGKAETHMLQNWLVCYSNANEVVTLRTHDAIIASLLRRDGVATSFWRNYSVVIITACVRLIASKLRWLLVNRPLPVITIIALAGQGNCKHTISWKYWGPVMAQYGIFGGLLTT